jgi:hypothetical protein
MKMKYKNGGMRPEDKEYGGGGMYYGKEGLKMVEKDGKKVPFFLAENGKLTRRGRKQKYNTRPNSAYNPDSEFFNPYKNRFARNVLKQNPYQRYNNQYEALERKLYRTEGDPFLDQREREVFDPPKMMGTHQPGVPGITGAPGNRVMTRPGMGVSLADEQAVQNQKAIMNRVLQSLVGTFLANAAASGTFAPNIGG